MLFYLSKSENKIEKNNSLVQSDKLTLEGEHVLKQIMKADRITEPNDCDDNKTSSDCCDKPCESIKFDIVRHWEVVPLELSRTPFI